MLSLLCIVSLTRYDPLVLSYRLCTKRKQSENGSTYDWYQSYETIGHLLYDAFHSTEGMTIPEHPHQEWIQTMPENCRVLILGCGNSPFGEQMRRDGWNGEIVNVDYSSVVIDHMRSKYEGDCHRRDDEYGRPKMKWICADVTKGLPFEDESFDLIVCKGTFDAVLCTSGAPTAINTLVKECVRILTPGVGCFFLVTSGSKDDRLVYLEHDNSIEYYWQNVKYNVVTRNEKQAYAYTCRKRPRHALPWNNPGTDGPLADVTYQNASSTTASPGSLKSVASSKTHQTSHL